VNEREIAAGLAETPGYRHADEVGDRLFVAGQVLGAGRCRADVPDPP
jgi:hypothetical protein